MEIIYTTSNSGYYYHKILTKLTLESWLDNDVLRRNMVKLVTILSILEILIIVKIILRKPF